MSDEPWKPNKAIVNAIANAYTILSFVGMWLLLKHDFFHGNRDSSEGRAFLLLMSPVLFPFCLASVIFIEVIRLLAHLV